MPTKQVQVLRLKQGQKSYQEVDLLAQEVAIALVYNGISHVVLMATPQAVEELAMGFSLTEGIVQSLEQIYDIETQESELGITVQMQIASACFATLKERRRQMSGRTGCGLCGIDSLEAVQPKVQPITHQNKIKRQDIEQALAVFERSQPLREQTGSLHGAAWVEQGTIKALYEDVGRHNALDKLLAHLVRPKVKRQEGFVLVSSRASFEMVAKAAVVGITCIVAVSAATELAQRLAEQANITLIGFARAERQTVYTHPEFLVED